jgi:hypothetical protein
VESPGGDGADHDAAPPRVVKAGFSVGGPRWVQRDTVGPRDRARVLDLTRRDGRDDADLAHRAGGRVLRVPFASSEVLGEAFQDLFWYTPPPYTLSLEQRIARLDAIHDVLTLTNVQLPRGRNHLGEPLAWAPWDAYLAGVEEFNESLGDDRIEVLIVLVEQPPMLILEAPSTATLRSHRREYSFESLWQDYVNVHIGLMRAMVRRFVTQAALRRDAAGLPAVTAIEILNEPDATWLPFEVRIESSDPLTYPGGKYITVLHHSQIPTNDLINASIEPTPWGFADQDLHWDGEGPAQTPVLSFRWGDKFDRYVKYCAELMRRLSYAARDEGSLGGVELDIVSGSVTHVNLDYLARMYVADPEAFLFVDKIGIHPYHWPEHDIRRTDFISDSPMHEWRNANPRDFARLYFKRFDFLEELRRLSVGASAGPPFGLGGKPIWITEFGVPTKKLGRVNRSLDQLFVYPRGETVPPAAQSVVWEDRWDAFLTQVDRDYLPANGVEAFLVYTLREGPQPAAADDDHSNYALYTRDGIPRMEQATYSRFLEFFGSLRQ